MKVSFAPALVSVGMLALYGVAVPLAGLAVLIGGQAVSWSIGSNAVVFAVVLLFLVLLVGCSPWLLAGVARLQEAISRAIFGLPIPPHALQLRHVHGDLAWGRSSLAQFTDRRNLWGLAHAAVAAVLGVLVVLLGIVLAAGIGLIAAATAAPQVTVFGFGERIDRSAAITLGALMAVVAIALAVGTILVFALVTRVMLVPSREAELRGLARAEQQRRSHAVQAADIERGRLERDLHDGVQPQLVSIAMTLGLARRKFDDDPQAARELLDEALRTTRTTVGDLRALVRGMRPAILSDKGLDAALSALASASAIPVRVDNRVAGRFDVQAELVIYFAIAESITNAAKHSGATQIDVVVRRADERIRAEVRDNGCGGAVRAPGGGIEGIGERVAAAGGAMSVSSPEGGPTVIEVMVPCES
ncbi:sensor histidine kinase [Gulosibacter faecalis]|jgi:signal transduction histidine kinase|uniref:histidine kinase n=1 Tax=Gulosibacter faecalis TaxID=272240 RepID=A0ABW5V0D0_9MICO|nr:histidine kinase [Gulosibacter faecalis]